MGGQRMRDRKEPFPALVICLMIALLPCSAHATGTGSFSGTIQYPDGPGIGLPGVTPDAATFLQNSCHTNQLQAQFAAFFDASAYQGRTITFRLTSPSGTIPWPGGSSPKVSVYGGTDCQPNSIVTMGTQTGLGGWYLIDRDKSRISFTNVFRWISIFGDQPSVTFTLTVV